MTLFEHCARTVIRDQTISIFKSKLTVTCVKYLETFAKEVKKFKDLSAQICDEEVPLTDIAMMVGGRVDIGETLKRMKRNDAFSDSELVHLRLVCGYEMDAEMWKDFPDEERNAIMQPGANGQDDDEEEGGEEKHLLVYKFQDYHNKLQKVDWNVNDKKRKLSSAFYECLDNKWVYAGMKLFKEAADSSPDHQVELLVNVWLQCFEGTVEKYVLAELVRAKHADAVIDQMQFENTFATFYDQRNRQLDLTKLNSGLSNLPDSAKSIIPQLDRWYCERMEFILMNDDMTEQEEMERILQQSLETERREAAAREAAAQREAEEREAAARREAEEREAAARREEEMRAHEAAVDATVDDFGESMQVLMNPAPAEPDTDPAAVDDAGESMQVLMDPAPAEPDTDPAAVAEESIEQMEMD